MFPFAVVAEGLALVARRSGVLVGRKAFTAVGADRIVLLVGTDIGAMSYDKADSTKGTSRAMWVHPHGYSVEKCVAGKTGALYCHQNGVSLAKASGCQ